MSQVLNKRLSHPISQWLHHGAGLIGLAVLFLVWYLIGYTFPEGIWEQFKLIPALQSLWSLLLHDSTLPHHIWLSLQRVSIGLLIALIIGTPIGLVIGSSSFFERLSTPTFQLLRMISPLSWMPIAVMVFGVGNAPIYFLLAFAGVWPIILNTAAGVKQVDKRWLKLAESLSATRAEVLIKIVCPSVVLHLLTGLRLAIGIVWIVLVPAEMLGVTAGLGYFILDARDRLAYSDLMAIILLIGMIGYILDRIVVLIQYRLVRL
jgi:NitT/TauT family transport system permease protein